MPSNVGGVGSTPGWGRNAKKPKCLGKKKSNIVTNSIKTLKVVHMTKIFLKKKRIM